MLQFSKSGQARLLSKADDSGERLRRLTESRRVGGGERGIGAKFGGTFTQDEQQEGTKWRQVEERLLRVEC